MPEGPRGGDIRPKRGDYTCACGKRYKNTMSWFKHKFSCNKAWEADCEKLKSLIITVPAKKTVLTQKREES